MVDLDAGAACPVVANLGVRDPEVVRESIASVPNLHRMI
jgi:hypothetical protein